MIVLHALWYESRLHLWAEDDTPRERPDPQDATQSNAVAPEGRTARPPDHPFAASTELLRRVMGDSWDLESPELVAQAAPAELVLRLPTIDGTPECSLHKKRPRDESGRWNPRYGRMERELRPIQLERWSVPTLAFAPADAVDLLTRMSAPPADPVLAGSSIPFWARLAGLVTDLVAHQRFVPDVPVDVEGSPRGAWRPVLDAPGLSEWLAALAACLPPACRAMDGPIEHPAGLVLIESFLLSTVDATVRRHLADDPLAAAVAERRTRADVPVLDWLAALVGPDSRIGGAAPTRGELVARARRWVGRLEEMAGHARFRTCFELVPPKTEVEQEQAEGTEIQENDSPVASFPPVPTSFVSAHDEPADSFEAPLKAAWRLRFLLQAMDDPGFVLEAGRIWTSGAGLTLLRRQYDDLRHQLAFDLQRAASLFAPLAECLARNPCAGGCSLDIEGAYVFLRDAAPVLENDGFGVMLPAWWTPQRPQFGLRLRLESTGSAAGPSGTLGLDSLVDYRWQVALGNEPLSEEEFARLCSRSRSLVQMRGRWVEARPEVVRAARELLGNATSGRVTLFEALRLSAGLAAPAGLPITGVDAEGWLGAVLDGGDRQSLVELPQPETFHGQLRPYQCKGLSWLAFLDRFGIGGCLADDMGLGKTIQLISLLLSERVSEKPSADPSRRNQGAVSPDRRGPLPYGRGSEAAAHARPEGQQAPGAERREIDAPAAKDGDADASGPTLLIVPTSLVGNWLRELQRFAPSLRTMVHHGAERLSGEAFVEQVARQDVVISTYALSYRDFEHLIRIAWHRVVLDEAQNIKNPAAKQTAAIRALRTRHRAALTGTPLENHLSELWSIMEFLNPGLLGTAGEFRRHFAVPIERQGDPQRAEQLQRLIRPFILRRRKTDPNVAADLPEKMEMRVFCNLSPEQAAAYQALVDDMLGQVDGAVGMRRRGLVLATLTRLKQLCNHPASFGPPEPAHAELPGRSGKCERLVEMLEEVLAEGERALLFTQFRRMGHLLETYIQQRLECGVRFLHGGTSLAQRDEMVQRFQEGDPEFPVFLLSLKAGGFGLNLTSATNVFHFDRWWNPAVEDQATDRAHRIGQTRRVQVYKFVCVGTLEERIDRMLEDKRDLAERIIGSGERWLTELSTDDLRELLTLSRDAVAEE